MMVIQITLDTSVMWTYQVRACKEKSARAGATGHGRWTGRHRRQVSMLGVSVLGDEGKSQEAGAEQHETGCSEGQEAVGNEVMMAHYDILLFRRSSELIKTFGTGLTERGDAELRSRPGSGPRQHSFKRVGNENPGANQSHHCCDHFEHRKHPLRPARSKRRASPHSQKDFGLTPHNRRQLRIFRNSCANSGQARVASVAQKQRLIHHRDNPVKATPFPPCSPCGILCFLMRRRARINANGRKAPRRQLPGWNGKWGEWGSSV
jgi:hypothetical protein